MKIINLKWDQTSCSTLVNDVYDGLNILAEEVSSFKKGNPLYLITMPVHFIIIYTYTVKKSKDGKKEHLHKIDKLSIDKVCSVIPFT